MDRLIEFGIGGVEKSQLGYLVIGRCHEETIRVGDVFTAVYKLTPVRAPDGGYVYSTRTGDRPVSFRVTSIEAYRRFLNELGPGSTARLELVGTGGSELVAGEVLGLWKDQNTPI
jgi:hypothetical protein